MREPQREASRETAGGLEAAARRLEAALISLETRLNRRMKRIEQMDAARAAVADGDGAALLAELQASRQRERALEAIAAEASAALGRAAEEVRAALSEPAAPPAEALQALPPPPSGADDALAPDEPTPEPLPRAAQG